MKNHIGAGLWGFQRLRSRVTGTLGNNPIVELSYEYSLKLVHIFVSRIRASPESRVHTYKKRSKESIWQKVWKHHRSVYDVTSLESILKCAETDEQGFKGRTADVHIVFVPDSIRDDIQRWQGWQGDYTAQRKQPLKLSDSDL